MVGTESEKALRPVPGIVRPCWQVAGAVDMPRLSFIPETWATGQPCSLTQQYKKGRENKAARLMSSGF